MKTVAKNVFYCDFCRKHGLSRPAMELHERICTMNPNRTCRWKLWNDPGDVHGAVDLPALVRELQARAVGASDDRFPLKTDDISWLRDLTAGCPACMLAALRQSGLEYHHDKSGVQIFDYQTQVEEIRDAERLQARGDMW